MSPEELEILKQAAEWSRQHITFDQHVDGEIYDTYGSRGWTTAQRIEKDIVADGFVLS